MIGQTISHYKILEKLGEGGMGVVYKALDMKLERTVALKFLPPHLAANENDKRRFIHEAKAVSALDHPNICTFYEIGEADAGQVFIAMAYYEGASLKEKIKERPLPFDDSLDLTIAVSEGLAHAHGKSIIHRDIKPENIMLTAKGLPKIMDFGLARVKGLSTITKTGATVGTLPYMSPEQARGEKVDHRTDIWSLGAVLYEMVTGQLPFKSEYNDAIVYMILNQTPEPVTSLRSGVPLELERIINKCLEKNPDERYQTVADLIADLKHIQRTISQSITPTAQLKQIPVQKKKYWYWMAAAAITVLVTVGIYLFILPTQQSLTNKRTVAVLPFTNLSGNQEDEYFTDGIMEDILTQLSKIGELNVISRTTMMQYKGMKKSLRDIGNEVHAGVVLEGSARRSGNRIRISSQLIDAETDKHLWAETYDRDMQDVFAIQSDVAKQIAAALMVKLAPKEKELIEKKPTENIEAYNYYLKGREYYYRYKKQDNETAIELFKKAISVEPNYALAWAGLGDAYAQRPSRYGFPNWWLDSAASTSRKAIELDKTSAEAYKALGLVYLLRGFHDSSIAANLQAVELNPNYWSAISNIGSGYSSIGKLCQSLSWFNKSILLAPMITGPFANSGGVYRLVGEYRKAEQFLRKASDLQFDERDTYVGVTSLYLSQGKDRKANELMNKLSTLNSENPTILEWAGYVAAMTGNLTKAKEYYQHSLSIRATSETINDSSGGTMLGYIFMKEGKRVQAEKILAKQFNLANESIKRGIQGGDPEYTLALVFAIQGKKNESCTYLKIAIEGGWRDYQMAVKDPRFENIRNDEEFKKLIALMKSKCDEQRKLIEQMEKEEHQ